MDSRKINIILDVIIIILVICAGIYVAFNYSFLKESVRDPCAVCMQKTGASCIQSNFLPHRIEKDYSDVKLNLSQ